MSNDLDFIMDFIESLFTEMSRINANKREARLATFCYKNKPVTNSSHAGLRGKKAVNNDINLQFSVFQDFNYCKPPRAVNTTWVSFSLNTKSKLTERVVGDAT
jgi:hypothetical protein